MTTEPDAAPMADAIPLTRAAYEEMQRELEQLRTEGRREVAERIQNARDSELDMDEDFVPAFEAAKEGQYFLEGRIVQLESTLAVATIIDEDEVRASETVRHGSTVIVDHDGEERTFQIVSSPEADAGAGKISDESPIGAALMGRRAGETVTVEAPAGAQTFRIKELR
jgi:transcription elongation factor GreA